jgi:hypothetical protein
MHMEQENTNIIHNRNQRYKYIPLILAAILGYYLLMMMLAPVKKLKSINDNYGFHQDEKNIINDSIVTDSIFLVRLKEKSFLQSRITMAVTDSISLSINLPDSTVNLEIAGVTVNSTGIIRMKTGRMLRDRYSYAISSMLSKPLSIEKDFSSIPREPLMIKMAPKDTSEYVPDIIPDTADYEPVNFVFELSDGIVVYVYQAERLKAGDGIRFFFFNIGYRFVRTWRSLKSVFILKVPEYNPYIKIWLPRTDAKIIYRALPEKGQISLFR